MFPMVSTISSELCLLQDPRVSLPSYLHIAYPTPDITKLLARAIRSSRSIPYGYLVFSLFRKQQQRNCRRRQVRRNIIHSQIVIPLKSFET
jgi:hypothetical protein